MPAKKKINHNEFDYLVNYQNRWMLKSYVNKIINIPPLTFNKGDLNASEEKN